MYLHLISFLRTDMTQVIEILPHVRQEFTYFTFSCVLMSWQRKKLSDIYYVTPE